MNTEQEREAFEDWILPGKDKNLPGHQNTLARYPSGNYMTYSIAKQWDSWQARAALQSQDRETCSWSYDESDGAHQTSCGNMHIIIDGTPDDNGMKYCCYCGGRITPAIDHARRVEGNE